MKLRLQRNKTFPTSTLGALYVDGTFLCYTLERPSHLSGGDAPYCIPTGVYPIEIRWSNHNNMNVPGIMSVIGRTDIEIHFGNYPKDTEGCILVGYTQDTDYVGQSRLAFQALMNKLTGQQGVTIEII